MNHNYNEKIHQIKKALLTLIFIGFAFMAKSQDNIIANRYDKRNEIKLNLITPLFGTFEASYERLLTRKSSLGLSILYVYTEELNEDVNYFITPYYRRYFGKKISSGFFAEGFGVLSSIDGKQITDINGNLTLMEEPDVIDFSLGLGIGCKWIIKKRLVFEVNAGLGKLLFNADKTDHDSVYRLGLFIGYKF